ncbi:MAG: toll/interleukin-1 receptor domain-containing protein, partial [Clostridia bacterium]|nr:toll/interleukin-1 receptor domain-containing protein [Clostridia bacterium]
MGNQVNANANGYEVFLSYRHKPLDNKVCKKTHTLLETFKPPRRMRKADIKRVFRDDEELPVAGVLSDTIGDALKSAKVLLVVCSPDTPQSQWVDREVRTFIEMGRSDKIYALLIEGSPESSFPPSLKLVPGIESRTLKVVAKSDRQRAKLLKKELVKVVAAATGTPYEPLRMCVKRRRIRRSIMAGAALTVFLFASGLYALFQWSQASYFNLYAQKEEIVIHQVITNTTFTLVSQLEEIPEASKGLVSVLENNIRYLDRMMAMEESPSTKSQALKDKGDNYLNLIRAYIMMGDADKASEAAKEAVGLYDAIRTGPAPADSGLKIANSYMLAGLYMHSLKREGEAAVYLEKA